MNEKKKKKKKKKKAVDNFISFKKAQNPGKYIRYIYNRLILENSSVRAAAASSLVKFAQALPTTLGPSIAVLLRRCVHDEDDEVRDRATLYLGLVSAEAAVPAEVGQTILSGEIGRYFFFVLFFFKGNFLL